MKAVYETFGKYELKDLTHGDLEKLVNYAKRMVELCSKNHIKGLGVPYCSALFHLQFPNLFPVIDRNILLGIGGLAEFKHVQKSGQIWKIENYYIPLIEKMYAYVQSSKQSLRNADRDLFKKGKRIYEEYKESIKY